ncbi:Premnaspirodiene oxygenase [Platanthera zijinensis]|uniref:Premnaspirodiene oxygenase n=1 Tax=Platanthera zijinensis TaxID=2320716 RepID=A0AAP0G1V6_9ASPA
MKESIKLLSMLRVADLFPSMSFLISCLDGSSFQMKRLRREMDAVLNEIIEEHVMKGEDGGEMEEDLVDVLLRIQRKGELQVPLTMDNVKAVILVSLFNFSLFCTSKDMLVAATETTSNTMCWVMSELMKTPNIMSKTQLEIREVLRGKTRLEDNDIHDLHYLHLVIKETLRMHPPLPLLLPRTCNKATELLGFHIPAKARVVVNVWAIGRDPTIWKDPESFCPERFEENSRDFKGNNYEYIPFGSGRRVCPGCYLPWPE